MCPDASHAHHMGSTPRVEPDPRSSSPVPSIQLSRPSCSISTATCPEQLLLCMQALLEKLSALPVTSFDAADLRRLFTVYLLLGSTGEHTGRHVLIISIVTQPALSAGGLFVCSVTPDQQSVVVVTGAMLGHATNHRLPADCFLALLEDALPS